MCTLLFRHDPTDEWPLALLANRDELYGRPAETWRWRDGNSWFGPLDLEAGGTWIGLNRHGLVAAITNIYPARKTAGLRSRGQLVAAIMNLKASSEVQTYIEAVVKDHALGWVNLLIADSRSACFYSWNELSLHRYELMSGVYQVMNEPFTGEQFADSGGPNSRWWQREAVELQAHPDVCKHGRQAGTRCSHKLLLNGARATDSIIWHCEGRPCESEYELMLGKGST
ncbi:MAG: NRDE family protein [Candidatus Marinimicrobia bacterium]|nr:NRDE family protein [Candidatus Neomarinimicrobiota bacterium]